ncbi:MAG: hypothetical protein HY791_13540 [Deltaproteobacteria bacterium]|nr:hypothetical protein [Deltaproteobacteria bacterium]
MRRGLLLLLAFACTDEVPREDGGELDAGTDAGLVETTTVTIAWRAVDVFDRKALEGVRVCVFEHPEVACAVTTSSGSFELKDVPGETKLLISFERADMYPVLRSYFTTRDDSRDESFALPPRETIELAGLLNDLELDPTKAIISFGVVTHLDEITGSYDRPTGVRAELRPPSGVPYFVNEASLPDTTRTETSSVGLGGFFAVDPGDYQIGFQSDRHTCARVASGRAWPGTESNAIAARAVAGWLTGAEWIDCE